MFKFLRYINWNELSGLLVGAALAIAVCFATYFLAKKLQEEGILFRDDYNLYSDFVSGQGLRKGTKVQINGVDIGNIDSVSLNNVSSGNGFVRIKLRLNARYKGFITDSSVVFATRDQNIISERVLNVDISKKGRRVLENNDLLAAGVAQDIETVLKTMNDVLMTANALIERVSNLASAADTLINMIRDTNTTVGALLGSKILYDNLDSTVLRLFSLVSGADEILTTLNTGMPKIVAFADTFSTDASGLINNLDTLAISASGVVVSLDTTIRSLSNMVHELSSITQPLNNLITDGSRVLNRTDDVMTGVSKFWFMRNKIPKKDSIPLLEETW